MDYKLLGNTGVKVSSLCMGTMTFGREADKAASAAIFGRCREVGINFFDCANVYANGESESILGELIANCRNEVIITSKVGKRMKNDVSINGKGNSRRHIISSVEASLKRLNTDHIDIYFLHDFDKDTELEDSLRALDDLVKQGKILYPAASNFTAWQYMKALGISKYHSWNPFRCIQPLYNLVKRQAEVEILPMAASEKLGVINFSPLAGGLLTGKYIKNQAASNSRHIGNEKYHIRYKDAGVHQTIQSFIELAEQYNYSPAGLAVAWAGYNPAITAPIIGARNIEQLEDSLTALTIDMTPELYKQITELSVAPAHATDRSELKLN